jgi:hypothetical protein
VGKPPDLRYRLCIGGAPSCTLTLGDLVARALSWAKSEFLGPIVLEALDEDGVVLWHAWHSTQASFETRVIELVSECRRPGHDARSSV